MPLSTKDLNLLPSKNVFILQRHYSLALLNFQQQTRADARQATLALGTIKTPLNLAGWTALMIACPCMARQAIPL